ncbi:carbohydrate kinase family protein [soil metagenome]
MHYDCLTIGNSVIDAFLSLADDNPSLKLDKPEGMLCVPYGQKLSLSACEFLLGGNATNVAVGLSRLGFSTALIAELANDEFSEKILNGLKKEKVKLDLLKRSDGQSSFSIGINFKGERTLFVEHHDREHDFSFDDIDTKLMYLTSLGHKWQHVYTRVSHYLQTHPSTLLAFNPGSIQIREGMSNFAFLLPLTTVLFLNREEAEVLLKKKTDIKDLLLLLKEKGPKVVVITDGEKGSYCIDERGSIYHKESLKVPVIERTGAGDAYATGFAAAYLLRLPVDTCMLWGTHNAASVIGQTGAEAGLLTKKEIEIKQ